MEGDRNVELFSRVNLDQDQEFQGNGYILLNFRWFQGKEMKKLIGEVLGSRDWNGLVDVVDGLFYVLSKQRHAAIDWYLSSGGGTYGGGWITHRKSCYDDRRQRRTDWQGY